MNSGNEKSILSRFLRIGLPALGALALLSSGCGKLRDSRPTGTLVEQAAQTDGSVRYRYLFNLTDVDSSGSTPSFGQCYWVYETNRHFDRFGKDNEARFCDVDRQGESPVENVNANLVDVSELLSAVYEATRKSNLEFWDGNGQRAARKQVLCITARSGFSFVGGAVGGTLATALKAKFPGNPVITTTGGAAVGVATGALLADSICEYITAQTLQEYDRVGGDPTRGGQEMSLLFMRLRDELAHGAEADAQSPLLSNDLSQAPTPVGNEVLSDFRTDQGKFFATEVVIRTLKKLDKKNPVTQSGVRSSRLEDYAFVGSQAATSSLVQQSPVRRCVLGSCRWLSCPRPQETTLCKNYRARKESQPSG